MKKQATLRLDDNLVLTHFLCQQIGDFTPASLRELLRNGDEGRRSDSLSHFFSLIQSTRLMTMPDQDLMRYDLNVLRYQDRIARHRSNFSLRYFQYLAVLLSEIYLDRYTSDCAALMVDLETFRTLHYPDVPDYTAHDMPRLAFYMATGAGKTLLMHVNLLQFLAYCPFVPKNSIVLAPTATLAEQHIAELRASGIAASHALDPSRHAADVQVVEMSKLYVPARHRTLSGGVSIPTTDFAGPNLIFVDEGHKGTTSGRDVKAERAWREIRDDLVQAENKQGFTFEYSATFKQVTETNPALLYDYGKGIAFDYSYSYFHSDRYGKDFRVFNMPRHDELYSDRLLLAGLLVNYAQHIFFRRDANALRPYNIEQPLLVFVGAQVTGGSSDVGDVIRFLDGIMRYRERTIADIHTLLKGQSELPTIAGEDPFAPALRQLRDLKWQPSEIYDNLCKTLFHGHGELHLSVLRQADGEIGMRVSNATSDRYFGVINVGNVRGLLKSLSDLDIVGPDDHITPSLFDAINKSQSMVTMLIGSKKFIEGWSSWRVSVMGLLRVGKNAGAQVLQLFGRGVRLKGKDMSLRRSADLTGTHPAALHLLETLFIFGLKADYLNTFLSNLHRVAGIDTMVPMTLELEVANTRIQNAGLQTPDPDPSFRFADHVVIFDPTDVRINIDLNPKLVVTGRQTEQRTGNYPSRPISTLSPFPFEHLYQEALRYKQRKQWSNLYITRAALRALLSSDRITITAPDTFFAQKTAKQHHVAEQVLIKLVQDALTRFMVQAEQQLEQQHLRIVTIDQNHLNFPRTNNGTCAYELAVPPNLQGQVEKIIKDQTLRLQEDMTMPLPRLHVDQHLYHPLLIKEISTGQSGVSSTPVSLMASERDFLTHLRSAWQNNSSNQDWQEYELYVLRNLPRKGIGFFKTAGFYPDFLLWLRKGSDQVLVFVDPKGLVYWSDAEEEKVSLLQAIHTLYTTGVVRLPMLGYIVTPTEPDKIPAVPTGMNKPAYLASRNVLLQQGDYIHVILDAARTLLLP